MKKEGKRVIVLTGEGKGKTSAALGMALRAVGHGLRVCLIHFIKRRVDAGERRSLSRLPGVEAHACGKGFVGPLPTDATVLEAHRQAAEAGLALAREKLADPDLDLVVLDEVCVAIALGLLSEQAALESVAAATPGKIIVLTGRDAPESLIALADTVSRIICVKHGMEIGWAAQPGVEL